MAIFGILQDQLNRISWQSTVMIEGEKCEVKLIDRD